MIHISDVFLRKEPFFYLSKLMANQKKDKKFLNSKLPTSSPAKTSLILRLFSIEKTFCRTFIKWLWVALIILIIKIHKNGRNGMSVRYVKKEKKIKMLSIVWFQEIHKLEVHAFKSRGLSIGSQQEAFEGASWGLPRKKAGKWIWIHF